jgi:hypothetical protein
MQEKDLRTLIVRYSLRYWRMSAGNSLQHIDSTIEIAKERSGNRKDLLFVHAIWTSKNSDPRRKMVTRMLERSKQYR